MVELVPIESSKIEVGSQASDLGTAFNDGNLGALLQEIKSRCKSGNSTTQNSDPDSLQALTLPKRVNLNHRWPQFFTTIITPKEIIVMAVHRCHPTVSP